MKACAAGKIAYKAKAEAHEMVFKELLGEFCFPISFKNCLEKFLLAKKEAFWTSSLQAGNMEKEGNVFLPLFIYNFQFF